MSDPQGWWANIHSPRVEYVTSEEIQEYAFRTGRTVNAYPSRLRMELWTGACMLHAPLPLPAVEVES